MGVYTLLAGGITGLTETCARRFQLQDQRHRVRGMDDHGVARPELDGCGVDGFLIV